MLRFDLSSVLDADGWKLTVSGFSHYVSYSLNSLKGVIWGII